MFSPCKAASAGTGEMNYNAAMPEPIDCDSCERPIPPHGHYIVRIDVLADPSMPPLSAEELANTDFGRSMDDLLQELGKFSTDELMDDVHRHMEFKLCRACKQRFILNPLRGAQVDPL